MAGESGLFAPTCMRHHLLDTSGRREARLTNVKPCLRRGRIRRALPEPSDNEDATFNALSNKRISQSRVCFLTNLDDAKQGVAMLCCDVDYIMPQRYFAHSKNITPPTISNHISFFSLSRNRYTKGHVTAVGSIVYTNANWETLKNRTSMKPPCTDAAENVATSIFANVAALAEAAATHDEL